MRLRDKLFREFGHAIRIARNAETIIDENIASISPSQFLKPLYKRGNL